jgi:toxin ParE1/3/4
VKLIVSPQAAHELREIEEYIGRDNPQAAVKFVGRLTERFDELVHFSGIGQKRDEIKVGYRSVSEGEYGIFYQVLNVNEKDALMIMRVIHSKRDVTKIQFS